MTVEGNTELRPCPLCECEEIHFRTKPREECEIECEFCGLLLQGVDHNRTVFRWNNRPADLRDRPRDKD